jgi:hypothetical protein
MDEDQKNVLAILGLPVAIGLFILLLIPFGILNAWVVQKLYEWFLLPLGLPALNLWHVWGILTIIVFLEPLSKSNKKITPKILLTSMVRVVFSAAFALLLGFILKGHIH